MVLVQYFFSILNSCPFIKKNVLRGEVAIFGFNFSADLSCKQNHAIRRIWRIRWIQWISRNRQRANGLPHLISEQTYLFVKMSSEPVYVLFWLILFNKVAEKTDSLKRNYLCQKMEHVFEETKVKCFFMTYTYFRSNQHQQHAGMIAIKSAI